MSGEKGGQAGSKSNRGSMPKSCAIRLSRASRRHRDHPEVANHTFPASTSDHPTWRRTAILEGRRERRREGCQHLLRGVAAADRPSPQFRFCRREISLTSALCAVPISAFSRIRQRIFSDISGVMTPLAFAFATGPVRLRDRRRIRGPSLMSIDGDTACSGVLRCRDRAIVVGGQFAPSPRRQRRGASGIRAPPIERPSRGERPCAPRRPETGRCRAEPMLEE